MEVQTADVVSLLNGSRKLVVRVFNEYWTVDARSLESLINRLGLVPCAFFQHDKTKFVSVANFIKLSFNRDSYGMFVFMLL